MRVVLDTSVLLAAFRSRNGASRRLLELALSGEVHLVASAALYFEREVLKLSYHMHVHGYSHEQTDRFLLLFAGVTEKTEIRFRWRPQLVDPDDEFVLEAAVAGRANFIVTFDVSDFLPAALRFGVKSPSQVVF